MKFFAITSVVVGLAAATPIEPAAPARIALRNPSDVFQGDGYYSAVPGKDGLADITFTPIANMAMEIQARTLPGNFEGDVGPSMALLKRHNSNCAYSGVETNFRAAGISNVSLLPMIGDASGEVFLDPDRLINPNNKSCDGYCTPGTPNPSDARHMGGSNIAYADGHVKWVNQLRMIQMYIFQV